MNKSTEDKPPLRRRFIDGIVLNGVKESVLVSFASDRLPGYKLFCEHENNHPKND